MDSINHFLCLPTSFSSETNLKLCAICHECGLPRTNFCKN